MPMTMEPESRHDAEAMHFSHEEVAMHNTPTDLWLIIDGDIYDMSAFSEEHPGGRQGQLSFYSQQVVF